MNTVIHFLSEMHWIQSLGVFLLVLSLDLVLWIFFNKRKNNVLWTFLAKFFAGIGVLLLFKLIIPAIGIMMFGIRIFRRLRLESRECGSQGLLATVVQIKA